MSISISAKQASSVTFVFLTTFTKQGPSRILQTNNCGEYSGQAHDYVGHWMMLEDEFICSVNMELKNLWLECQMTQGSPRHSESNRGIDRVNQTVHKKLGGTMKTNNSRQWSIGCKICQWGINNQVHETIKATPYHLTYGHNPWVGISNLPVSEDILANLVTEVTYRMCNLR